MNMTSDIRGLAAILLLVITPLSAQEQDWIATQLDDGTLVGLMVADIEGDRIAYQGHGQISADNPAKPGENTMFEIGSITKVYTNLLLAEMAAKDLVAYDSTVSELWPALEFANPQVGDITLQQLATHTSGLPRLPANLAPADLADPYADYGADDLRAALATVRAGQSLSRDYAYSNLGAGLLGYLLGLADGSDYATALQEHVLAPLQLEDTTLGCAGDAVAPGHSGGQPVSHWTLDALAGAGALCGSARELVGLLGVYLHDRPGLAHDPAADLEVLHPAGEMAVTRVWHVAERGNRKVYWHNGGTGGYRSFVGFDPDAVEAHVLLANSDTDVTGYGLSLFGEAAPVEAMPDGAGDGQHAEYLGHYQITPSFTLSVTETNGTLYVQATGQPQLTLAETGKDRFSLLEVDAQLEFLRSDDGAVDRVILHQGGGQQTARRVDAPATVTAYQQIDVDPAVLDDYVGRYRLAPGAELVVTRAGDGLQVKLGPQPAYPVFPHARDQFFYKVVDAQLTFNRADGEVVSLTLHQHGMDQLARKIE